MPRRKRHRRRTPVGAPPGTLIPDPSAPKPIIRLMSYSSDGFTESVAHDPLQVRNALARWPVTWINVDGLGDVETISRLADILGLHPLAVEDTVSAHQRAKVEHYDNHVFIVAHRKGWIGPGARLPEGPSPSNPAHSVETNHGKEAK